MKGFSQLIKKVGRSGNLCSLIKNIPAIIGHGNQDIELTQGVRSASYHREKLSDSRTEYHE